MYGFIKEMDNIREMHVRLEDWIQPAYLSQQRIASIKKQFSEAVPFPYVVLKDFFVLKKLKQMNAALQQESFKKLESDLLKFSQTNDLSSSSHPAIKQFYGFLSSPEFRAYMAMLSGFRLSSGLDCMGSLYEDTSFLLPHDDRLESRKIAYMIYCSSSSKHDGGMLCLYDSKKDIPSRIVRRILPVENQFVFFAVSKKSFHGVSEIKRKKRLTMNGWFHGRD